jgi:hypothetical protein
MQLQVVGSAHFGSINIIASKTDIEEQLFYHLKAFGIRPAELLAGKS